MHASTSNLELALAFVMERISDEAERSGQPLNEDDRYLLEHLPTEPTNPTLDYCNSADEYSWPTPILRDFQFERVSKLAKDARVNDIRIQPVAEAQWEYAAAVLELNRHPMYWLLQWAGAKKQRPPWDIWLLIGIALLLVVLFGLGAIGIDLFSESRSEFWKRTLWVAGAALYTASIVGLYFATRRLGRWQAMRRVEKYRCDLRVRASKNCVAQLLDTPDPHGRD